MSSAPKARTLGDLARSCGAQLRGPADLPVVGVAPLDAAGPEHLSFYANAAYRRQLASCRAGAVVVTASDAELPELAGRPLLVADVPYAAFAKVAAVFHPPESYESGVDPMARVDAGAEVDPSARVEAFAVVSAGAKVGARAVIRTGAFVGAGARIGEETVLHPRSVVADGCRVGARCIIHPGAVIGADGFGFAFDPAGDGEGPVHRKVPQAGIARVEDDVEIGANACIDRATFGETVIGRGSKIDNLVQIAHNVQLGPLCVIASQTGIAGSAKVGAGVAMGGQVGVVGHLTVGDMARVAARSAIAQDVSPGATVMGTPATEGRGWLRSTAVFHRLPEMLRELRRLRRDVDGLLRRASPKSVDNG